MKRFRNRRSSLYGKLGALLALSAVVSALFFAAVNAVGEYAIYAFVTHTDYMEQRTQKDVQALQTYVTQNHVAARDGAALAKWVKTQSTTVVQVYRNGYIVFDSQYPDAAMVRALDGRRDVASYYTLTFADGSADVVLYGFYDYRLHIYALIAEIVLTFLLFLGIVMLGIRRTIRSIRTLSKEVRILEGGDLTHPIAVEGTDELAQLAEGLDAMRRSLQRQTEQKRQLTLENQRMITEMSHDLRTPLTSIMLYTEILLKKKGASEERRTSYIQKIDQKARRLKQLSDHLFEYALVSEETEIPLEEPRAFRAVFYDVLSDTTAYLEQQGFQTALEFTWEERYIRVNSDYIGRIFDNLASNIVKYADPSEPVGIRSVYAEQSAGFSVQNARAVRDERAESTKIGLKNIQRMMEKMNGKARVEHTDERFTLILQFPTCSSADQ